MKYLWIGLVSLLSCQLAKADVILTASINGPSSVNVGTNIIVDVFVRSTVSGGELIDGIDVNVNAATTNNGVGTGAAGKFVTPSQTFLLGSTNFDVVGNGAGQAFSTNFQNGGITIADTDTLYGKLTLDTTGVTAGSYFINLDQLAANNPNTGPLLISPINTSYTVTVVPEPGSLAIMGLASCAAIAWRRRRHLVFAS